MAEVWAITMVKDEEDTIATNLAHLIGEGVDGIIVANNLSSDGTQEQIDYVKNRFGTPVVVIQDEEVAYYQSEKMTGLANMAAQLYGANWIIPFDADEIWNSTRGTLKEFFDSLGPDVNVAEATLYNHVCTAIDDENERGPFVRMQWLDPEPNSFKKVAFRWEPSCVIEQGNHEVTFKSGKYNVIEDHLVVDHFPVRSFDHFVRKAENGGKAYAATTLPDDRGDHWRRWGALVDSGNLEALREIFETNFYSSDPETDDLVHSPVELSIGVE